MHFSYSLICFFLQKNEKINHILEIWESGFGVISLHCFENSIPVEAYTREACIIEAVGKYAVIFSIY